MDLPKKTPMECKGKKRGRKEREKARRAIGPWLMQDVTRTNRSLILTTRNQKRVETQMREATKNWTS